MKPITAFQIPFKYTYLEELNLVDWCGNFTQMKVPQRIIDSIDHDLYYVIGFHAVREMTEKGETSGAIFLMKKN